MSRGERATCGSDLPPCRSGRADHVVPRSVHHPVLRGTCQRLRECPKQRPRGFGGGWFPFNGQPPSLHSPQGTADIQSPWRGVGFFLTDFYPPLVSVWQSHNGGRANGGRDPDNGRGTRCKCAGGRTCCPTRFRCLPHAAELPFRVGRPVGRCTHPRIQFQHCPNLSPGTERDNARTCAGDHVTEGQNR